MTDTNDPVPAPGAEPAPAPYSAPAPDSAAVPAPAAAYAAPAAYAYPTAAGPVGKIRGTGACIGLSIVTLGIYSIYWYYKVHSEMKAHSGQGIGGGLALLLALVVGIVMPFITPNEVGGLYERQGKQKPVSATTGLWYLLLGWFFLVGAIVWFVKTNGALNEYWRSQGAQG